MKTKASSFVRRVLAELNSVTQHCKEIAFNDQVIRIANPYHPRLLLEDLRYILGNSPTTLIPMLRAVPATIRMADSSVKQFMSGLSLIHIYGLGGDHADDLALLHHAGRGQVASVALGADAPA